MRTTLFLFLVSLLIIRCSPEEQPITKEEAITVAKRLQSSIAKGHSQSLDSMFMNQAFADRIIKEVGNVADKEFTKSLTQTLNKKTIGRDMLKVMGKNDSYEFIRHYEKDNRHHLLFRIYGDVGINYHDMELVKYDGRIGLADMYIYLSGENISKTFGRAMALMLDFDNKQAEDKMLSAAKSVQEIRSLMNIGQNEKASRLYEKLPADFKKEKAIQLMNIAITAELDTEQYKQALATFEKAFGQDPSAQLPLFDFYLLNEDYTKALKVLDVMDVTVKDPLLNFHRSLLYSKMNDKANSLKYLELLYKEMPAFGDGMLELIANYIEAGEMEKAEKVVAAYRSNKTLDQEKLENLKFLYPHFTALNQP